MITRDELLDVIKKKERQSTREIKEAANRTIESASKALRRGRFHLPQAPANPAVFNLVKKAFASEGIDVTMEVREISSRSARNKPYTFTNAVYRFKILEE